ncbi:MAG: sortase [Patescibacteria group bacterium]|nr:sortase [Patescibacteria group bacterium]
MRVLILRTLGNFLIFSSLFIIGKTFSLPIKEEIRYLIERKMEKRYLVEDKETFFKIQHLSDNQPKGLLAKALNLKKIEVLIPPDPYFSIVIPKIGAKSKVLANIDPADEKIYLDALNKGVAHALGTAFPGEGSHIFLFAHSTDYFWNVGTYNAIFYLLGKLEKGDEINIFYKNQRYVYKVIGKKVVDPSEVYYLTRKSNREFLTLQTCWPPGTTLKRLLVFAVRVSE